jgi:hypothetical protein
MDPNKDSHARIYLAPVVRYQQTQVAPWWSRTTISLVHLWQTHVMETYFPHVSHDNDIYIYVYVYMSSAYFPSSHSYVVWLDALVSFFSLTVSTPWCWARGAAPAHLEYNINAITCMVRPRHLFRRHLTKSFNQPVEDAWVNAIHSMYSW